MKNEYKLIQIIKHLITKYKCTHVMQSTEREAIIIS